MLGEKEETSELITGNVEEVRSEMEMTEWFCWRVDE